MLPTLLKQLDFATDKIFIVDNNSPDDSLAILEKFLSSHELTEVVRLIASDSNDGFSAGNNKAIKTSIEEYKTKPSYVWLLNPDTYLFEHSFTPLVNCMMDKPKVGILGSRLESEDGVYQCSGFRYHTATSELLSALRLGFLDNLFEKYLVSPKALISSKQKLDWVAGASMFVRYKVFEDTGGMDETYFLYFEETDFCLQAKRAGWECWYVPESRVVHYVGQSTGVVSGDVQRRRRPKYWFQSRQYYFKKNYGVIYTMLADLAWGLGFSLLKLRYLIQRKKRTDPEHMLRDFWRNSIFLSWLDRF
tara:strand:- start:29902 stop:30816 length:915 start_codon:yes stop_codon:yes gene_type:complete